MRFFNPGGDRLPGLLGDLKLHRSMGLALQDHGAWQNALALRDIANTKIDQVAATQLTVNGEVEQSQVSRFLSKLQSYADCLDLLQLERRLLFNQPALVPRSAGCYFIEMGFHGILLKKEPHFCAGKGRLPTQTSQLASSKADIAVSFFND